MTPARSAAEEGALAFWRAVAECYPGATSGDLDPETDAALTAAMVAAVEQWLTLNLPPACPPKGHP